MCDSGIINALGKTSQGQLFEQSVFQNLRGTHQLAYYSKGVSSEIDFIIDGKTALEVKYTMSQQDLATLKKRSKTLKIIDNYIVIHQFNDYPKSILVTNL